MKTFKSRKKKQKSKGRKEQKYSMTKKLKMILQKVWVPMKMKETKLHSALKESS
jgi:predicted transcriptional regulator